MLKSILNPDLYHGKRKRKNFFEGWYFKITDKSGKNTFAFIPGIYKGREARYNHSFIQIIDGKSKGYSYIKGSEQEFKYSESQFEIEVMGSRFSEQELELNISEENKTVAGVLKFKNIVKWESTKWNPGSMGYYNYLTFMQCYSQVTLMDAEIVGSLRIDGREIDFAGGKLYVEKNWGVEFPLSWIWIQSNSFSESKISFTCSIGRVPMLGGSFKGFLAGLYLKNTFYKFTTMNGAKLETNSYSSGSEVKLKFTRKNLELKVHANSDERDFVLCNGPRDGAMIPLVKESLNGKVKLELKDLKSGKIIYSGIGNCAGMEFGGTML